MNATQVIAKNGFFNYEAPVELRAVPVVGNEKMSTAEHFVHGTSDAGSERFQQRTSRMERLQLSKQIETNELQHLTSDSVCADKNTQALNESVNIHRARHAAMGELLGVVAHKWRQPLNSIALIIHNIVDAWKYGEMNEELLKRSEVRAMEQINLISRSIDNFRSFLDPDTTTEYFDPVESVKVVVDRLSDWFSDTSTIDIRVTNAAGGQRATGCQNAFERVIVNLLCNANDAIEERACDSGITGGGAITVSVVCNRENIIISVEDNGAGIDESNWKRVFEPYFTTKDKAAGFGMGLYLSKLIIENSMDGYLWFEHIPGGARFSIRLPALMGEGTGE